MDTRRRLLVGPPPAPPARAHPPRPCRGARPSPDDRHRGRGHHGDSLVECRRHRVVWRDIRASRAGEMPADAAPPRPTVAAGRRRHLACASVEDVLVIVHLLAAMVWVGGTIALVFVGVPAIRTLEGEPRGRAMRALGLRWRPLGYGALLVAAVTGIALAAHDWSRGRSPFQTVLWVKVALAA